MEQDLEDPRWIWRHRLAQLVLFGIVGVVTFSALTKVLGKVPWSGSGGFVGAFLGQVGFSELKRRQTQRAQLSPSGSRFSRPLPFPHRVVLSLALLVLILSSVVAAALAIRTDDRCRPASVFATRQLERSVQPDALLGDGYGVQLEDDFVELVVRPLKASGASTEIGLWAVRADGNVIGLNSAAGRVTTSDATSVSFSATSDVAKAQSTLYGCVVIRSGS